MYIGTVYVYKFKQAYFGWIYPFNQKLSEAFLPFVVEEYVLGHLEEAEIQATVQHHGLVPLGRLKYHGNNYDN